MINRIDIVAKAHTLKGVLNEHASQYYHSKPLIEQRTPIILENRKLKHTITLNYGIKDILLVGALTQSSILMTGGTDWGKTTLAKLVMNSLFGKEAAGWYKININVDFNMDMIVKTDFGAIIEGKDSEVLYVVNPRFLLPGLIVDEINRSHAKIVTNLMHIFDMEINMPNGTKAKLGYEYEPGRTYQFQVAAINEGEEYSGTFDIDKAMRRRTIIEIPMDVFTPTPEDRRLARNVRSKEVVLNNKTNHVSDIIEIYKGLGQLDLHENADLFLAFLEAFDFCEHSLTKEKGSIPAKGGSIYHVCTKPIHGADLVCRFIKSFENELCPYIRGITPGISKNLVSVAKGLAVLRAVKFAELLHSWSSGIMVGSEAKYSERLEYALQQYTATRFRGNDLARAALHKYVAELKVRPEDIEAIFGFVAYSKVGLSSPWIAKHYQGNRFEAVRTFVTQANEKFEEGVAHLENVDVHSIIGSGLAENHKWRELEQYCTRENPWFLKAMGPYIKPPKGAVAKIEQMDYLYKE